MFHFEVKGRDKEREERLFVLEFVVILTWSVLGSGLTSFIVEQYNLPIYPQILVFSIPEFLFFSVFSELFLLDFDPSI